MKKKVQRLDPERLKKAKARVPQDPLDPRIVDTIKRHFKPEVAEQYIKDWESAAVSRKR